MECVGCHTTANVSKSTLKCRRCYNRDYYKTYGISNKEKLQAYKHDWYLQQKDQQLERARSQYDLTRERRVRAAREWKKRNPEAVYYSSAKRRADKEQRTPKWANLVEIKKIYSECPEDMTIDHIIPLNGTNVCGLHVEYNLQYLAPSENYQKNKSFDGTYENESWKNRLKRVA